MRRREFVRARVNIDAQGQVRASLFPKQGSDVLSSTVWASGLIEIPEHATVSKGDLVAYLDFEQLLH
jgi:molybdopterin molybdotransferase